MAIIKHDESGLISLHTANTTYQMKVDEIGTLVHTYYGAKIDETDMSSQLFKMIRGFSSNPNELGYEDRPYSLDIVPQEYSGYGTGDYRITGLHVRNADGSRAVRQRFVSAEVRPGLFSIEGLPMVYTDEDDAQTLVVTMHDPESKITVELLYGVMEHDDIIVRAARVTNKGTKRAVVEKAASMNIDFPYSDLDFISFYGRHAQERVFNRIQVPHGITSVGSVRGISSHHYNPFTILCDHTATETAGNAWGFSLMYSGEFTMEVEKDQIDQIRMIAGINPTNFYWVLEPGETFNTPAVIMSFSSEGLGKLSQNLHECILEHVVRGPWKHKRRPVLINNWEATYFDFTGEQLIGIAKKAKELGVEMFVMDDGWFGQRNDDDAALGDWIPNEEKLGMTLPELVKRITDMGLLFGIWFEPEAISPDSDLYRKHPEWAVTIPGRAPAIDRRQLVLDYTRADVREYIIDMMSTVLSESKISYVKWDMNRSISDKFSQALDTDHEGEFSHRFVLGLYEVLEALHQRFPDVLIEGCSGGGGRFDAGMLYYTPQIWTSDNTDALDRLTIQYGTSFGYPIRTMGAHVSAVPNHQSGRVVPLETRGVVAMAGTFGYELDITKMTEEEFDEVRDQIKKFHKFYDLIQFGNYYRITTPKDFCTVWEMAAKDGSEALVSAVYHGMPAYPPTTHVCLRGLKPEATYQIDVVDAQKFEKQHKSLTWSSIDSITGITMSGAALMNAGYSIPPAFYDLIGWQVHIHEV